MELGKSLPLDVSPIKLASWMGGDRDGNPFVTHQITREVLLLSRWKAADLYLNDINELFDTGFGRRWRWRRSR